MVTADELARCLKGSVAFLNRRPEGMRAFEVDGPAFGRSFAALALTVPAYIVSLALVRRRLDLAEGSGLFDDPGLALVVAAAHLLGFLALPVAMIFVARRLGLGARYVPFVIVTNWLGIFASLALAVPGTLLLLGWEPPSVAALLTLAFAAIALHVQWFATRVALGVGAGLAAGVTGLGLVLSVATGALVRVLAA